MRTALIVVMVAGTLLSAQAERAAIPPAALTATQPVCAPVPIDLTVFRDIARAQNPAVVAIMTRARVEAPSAEDVEWFERFFQRQMPRGPATRRDIGSGFLISRDGEILTNDHLVAEADAIEVRVLGRETTAYRATVVGRDPASDSALIRLQNPPADLPFAVLGDSNALETGDWVMAIGNPFQLGHSVTVGVVSFEGRPFELEEGRWVKLIQTDAAINPGNSGGPLLNIRGEVVGINVAMVADDVGDSTGIGLAIPINDVKGLLPQLRAGRVVRGRLGVELRRSIITDEDAGALGLSAAAGALIMSVERGSTAAAAGLLAGDVLVALDGRSMTTADDFAAAISAARPGGRARVALIRDGRPLSLTVLVEEAPPALPKRETRLAADVGDFGLTLGDSVTTGPGRGRGPLVQGVRDHSPADRAGVETGDVVRKVNQRIVHTAEEATRALDRIPPGSPAFLLISREADDVVVELHRE